MIRSRVFKRDTVAGERREIGRSAKVRSSEKEEESESLRGSRES
jgi:hypothetical protein